MYEISVRFHDNINPKAGALAELTLRGKHVVGVEVDWHDSDTKTIETATRSLLALAFPDIDGNRLFREPDGLASDDAELDERCADCGAKSGKCPEQCCPERPDYDKGCGDAWHGVEQS
jgi:hypothetical protein